jgi:hypothetical protein
VKFNKRPDICKKLDKEADPAIKRKKVTKYVKRSSSLNTKDQPDPHAELLVKGRPNYNYWVTKYCTFF